MATAMTDREAIDYALLFAQSSEVLLVLRPDTPRFTMVAATDERLRATHAMPETLGRGLFEVFPENADHATATRTSPLRASLERVLLTRQRDTMPVEKYEFRSAAGEFETRHWRAENVPILGPDGDVRYIVHRLVDVPELVPGSEPGHQLDAALRELRETNSKLAELDVAKSLFFSNISHEFRTPLSLILGTLEDELATSPSRLPPQSRMQLKAAYRNSLRLVKLVNSLLDFSRIEAGRMQVLYQPTNLGQLTAELAGNFHSAVSRGGLTLTVDSPALPEPVYVDHDMWEKIVLNLMSNAFKHTFKGSISVRLALVAGNVQLTVEDTGVGIAAEELPRLFDRFHRVAGAPSRSHEGAGIGLALVKELVQLHAGLIEVDSVLGRGSRFVVTLKPGSAHLPQDRIGGAADPAASRQLAAPYLEEARQWASPEVPDADVAATPAAVIPTAAATSGWAPPRARVLWADDNADMRAYVTRLLERFYDVTAVADGQAALESALASPPDLILSDLMMPRLDGFGLLRALRGDPRTRRLPIILLSARAGEEAAVAGLDTGADDYLVKPFSARELLARVRTHVELAWQRRSWENELERRVVERTTALNAEIERREQTERSLEAQVRRLGLLDQITRAMAERHDLRSIFEVVVRSVEGNLPADVCWIGSPAAISAGIQLEDGLVYVADIRGGPIELPAELAGLALRSLVVAPLRAEGELLGVLLAGRREPDSFNPGNCEFLRQLSEHVAIAARHGQLHESLQAAYDDLHLTQQTVQPQRPTPGAPSPETHTDKSQASTR